MYTWNMNAKYLKRQNSQSTKYNQDALLKLDQQIQRQRRQNFKYTIRQDTNKFKCWNFLLLINCLLSTLMYPYFMILDTPTILNKFLMPQLLFETIFLVEIIINFLKQDLMEDETSKCERLEDISYRYFTSGFASDLIVLLPWGYMFTYFNPRLKFMWIIKAVRIKELLHYMSNKVILGPVHSYYELKQ